jgi:hypothetical protein
MMNTPKEGNILIGLPGEPEDVALKIVKKTVNWISANKGIEMTYYCGEEGGQSMIFLEVLKQDDWKDDDVRSLVGFIGHIALKMRDEVMGNGEEWMGDSEGEEWKNGVN